MFDFISAVCNAHSLQSSWGAGTCACHSLSLWFLTPLPCPPFSPSPNPPHLFFVLVITVNLILGMAHNASIHRGYSFL